MSTLEFREVSVRYGSGRRSLRAVDGVSLTIPAGRVVGLVGESGSGKSTLARAAVGLAPLGAGQILLAGTDVARADRRVQLIFQDPGSSLDPRMSVGDSIAEALRDVRGAAAKSAEVARLLDLMNLDPNLAAQLPGELSGGQRQRVALARCLAARPDVVIADEITSALDVSVQGAMLNLVRELSRRLGLTMLFISHNLAVVRYVSDIVAVLYLGRIVEVAPTEQLMTEPRHPYTKALLDSVPRLGGRVAEVAATPIDDAEPADPHEPPAGCRFHPRCPIGPLVVPGRTVCVERDPAAGAAGRPHRAACHFAGGALV